MLGPAERLAWLRLYRSERIGPITFAGLLRRFGSASAALEAMPGWTARDGKPLALCSVEDAERELALAGRAGARLVAKADPDYPEALARLDDAPVLFYAKGKLDLAARPCIAVVGARNASAMGARFARTLAADLGAAGLTVVSGLARGIDAAAHRGALESGTAAVLGTGIDIAFPPENATLYEEIAVRGLLVSDYPPGTAARPQQFPRRNRIISGLSLGIVVVEGALKSGSLTTARYAADQGREVFAVPGSPLDPRANGPNNLIRQGATLTESAIDVLAVVQPMIGRPAIPVSAPEYQASARDIGPGIEQLLGPVPTPVDELVRQSGLAPADVAVAILELEMNGRIARHPGNKISRT